LGWQIFGMAKNKGEEAEMEGVQKDLAIRIR